MQKLPKISIIIPSYNQADYLGKALNSLALQEYGNLEVIVIDGESADGTVEILKSSSIVTKFISEKDSGQTNALNKGFRLATGDIYGWLNCDERYLPGTLNKIGRTFSVYPDLDIVFGNRIVVDPEGKKIKEMKLPNLKPYKYIFYAGGILYSDTSFWKSELHKKTGELDEVLCKRYGMDYDWFGRMSLNIKKWKYIDHYLSEFTEHKNRVSVNVEEMPTVSMEIRLKLFKLAGIKKIKLLLLSPYYLSITRFRRLSYKEYYRLPSLKSILRVSGITK